ncbi:imidazolonepropionase [Virgibacillus halodenitrificans]|uniref:imidazolonepropionase n=1 Tax=Virgibacillus halodenitrificans TaxID=1482 RepID=UPI001368F5C2|nr:imidazolonepropionase [Virgibacillus halodenitrificans]MYL45191.1 imidazolonepropionase [Virgibacillus halodenitrificans]
MAKQKADLIIANAKEILTCTGEAADSIGKLNDSWIAIAGEKIIAVGDKKEVDNQVDSSGARIIDAGGKVVVPGFVDSHTHAIFGGSRVEEYAAKMTVSDPKKLEEMGIKTGVMVSVNKTRDASKEELFNISKEKLDRMLQAGTTTVEVKSGYGLTTKDELKILEVASELNESLPIDVVNTFLGAHGWPEDMSKEAYIKEIIEEMIPQVAEKKLATFCDVWTENSHFNAKESRDILEAGLSYGMQPKIHTDAYSYVEGSDLAADIKAVSADHLNYTPPEVMKKMADAGVVGVVMPTLDFAVAHPRPFDVRTMIEQGLPVALATNLNPGNWTESMQFVMVLACRLYHMSPEEAIRAATINGAKALQLENEVGSIEVGKLADLQIWDVPSYNHVIYRLGSNVVDQVIKRGKVIEK